MTDPDALLAGLDLEQREVARALHGPVCVLAGAGTGKTRAITHRIAYGVATGVFQPNQVLAVTFTARAAGEMRGRLRALGAGAVQARTFHSAALRQLQYFWPQTVGGPSPRILESKIPMVAEAASACRMQDRPRRAARPRLRDRVVPRSTQTAPDDYAAAVAKAQRVPPREPAEVSRVYAAYEEHKRDRGFIDFEDVLLLTIGVLEVPPGHRRPGARAVPELRRRRVPGRQPAAAAPARAAGSARASRCAWSATRARPSTRSPAPAPEYLLGFPDRHRDATVIRLVRDYRSTPQVVGAGQRAAGRDPAGHRRRPARGAGAARTGRPARARTGRRPTPSTRTSRPRPRASPRTSGP